MIHCADIFLDMEAVEDIDEACWLTITIERLIVIIIIIILCCRKVSATLDLPPTYSSLSLHPAAEDSVRPPAYCDLFTSNLQYLDPELGQPRTKRSLSSSTVTLPVSRLQPANSYSEDTASTRRISV